MKLSIRFSSRNFAKTKKHFIFALAIAKIAQLVEHNLAKVGVAGSSPVFRSDVRMAELVDALL